MTPQHEAAYRHLAAKYRTDPVRYGSEFLSVVITPQQAMIAAALNRPPYKVLVPSANKVGKTFAAGWLVNHFHDAHDPGIVLATSTTGRQVRTQLFKEVRKLRPFQLGLLPKASEIQHTENHKVLGFATNKADAFQGHHETALLLVMDEATGVPGEYWDRAETMFTGSPVSQWVCFYNPNDTTSPAFAAEQSEDWAVVRLSALEHPNILAELLGESPVVPAAIRLARVERRIRKECEYAGENRPEGEETAFLWPPESSRKHLKEPANAETVWGWWVPTASPNFEVQILGRWPSKALQAVWSPVELNKCFHRSVEVDPSWPVQIGCDMARGGGAKITVAVRKGIALLKLLELNSSIKSRIVADTLRQLCHDYCPPGKNPRDVPVLIDDTGGYGSGVCDYPDGYSFYGVKASSRAQEEDKYPNTRSELWWALKIAAEEGGFVLGNCREGKELLPLLRDDLTTARYALDHRNRRVVESKEKMSDRLKRSPDYADAVCLSWYPLAI